MALTIVKQPANPLFAKNEISWKVSTNLTGVKLLGHLFVEENHGDEDWVFVKKVSITPDVDGVAYFFAEKALDRGVLSYQNPSISAESIVKSLICRNIRWEFYEEAADDLALLHTFYHSGSANKLIQFDNVPDESTYLLRLYYVTAADVTATVIGFGTTGSPPSGVNFPIDKDDAWQLSSDFKLYQDILLDLGDEETLNAILLPPFVKAELYAWGQPTTTLSAIRYALKGGQQIRNFAPNAGPPAAPSGFTITATAPGELTLDWTDNSAGLATYEIQRSADGIAYAALDTTLAGVEDYEDDLLADATQLYYRIRSSLGGATSAWVLANGTTFNPFRSTWKTDNAGTSASNQIAFPLVSGGTYNFNVWYNGAIIKTIVTHTDNIVTFTDGAGTKSIAITGTLQRWAFALSGDRLKLLTISNWGIFNHGTSTAAFQGCTNMNVTATDNPTLIGSMRDFFRQCPALVGNSSFNNWDTSSVTSLQNCFDGCTLFNQALSNWDTSSVTFMAGCFVNCSAFNQNISTWHVSSVTATGIDSLFKGCTAYNQPLDWDISIFTNLNSVFSGCTSFNQSLDHWVVSNVTTMSDLFGGCTIFNQSLNSWDVSKVTNMSNLFRSCTNFNGNITSWSTPALTNLANTFERCTNFNQNIGSWNVSNVTTLNGTFWLATSFNQNISGWDVSKVTTLQGTFLNASSFNQNIASWNVGKATNMSSVFQNATSFNQNIGAWDVISRAGRTTINMINMLSSSGINTANYSSTLVGWEAQVPVSGVALGATGRTYTIATAGAARTSLITTYGWTITDAGGV